MNPGELPLRDLHLPEVIGLWPPAPGWWLVGLALLLLLVHLMRRLLRIRRHPRRIALTELESIRQRYASHHDAKILITDCNHLLKRYVLSLYPRAEVAGLSGQAWVAFLNDSLKTPLAGLELLATGPYQAVVGADVQPLLPACERFIRQHKGGGRCLNLPGPG